MPATDKRALVNAFRTRLEQDLAILTRRQADTQAGATHSENRSEHAKDTRATEESYLARGLAERVEDLRRNLDAIAGLIPRSFDSADAIAVGALVTVEIEVDREATEHARWLLLPGVAGLEVETPDGPVRSVTPISPLGQALLGLEVGDEGRLRTPSGERAFAISAVE